MKHSSVYRFSRTAAVVLTVLTATLRAPASDWNQWGGSTGRNMYSPAKGLPDSVNPGKMKRGTEEVDLQTTKNVQFVLKLGSQTYGNPTVAKGKIFVGTNNESPRDPKHVGDRSVLLCFSERTGEFLWQLVVPKLKSGKVNDWEYLGILSSPNVTDDNKLYLVTSRCEVMCLDINGLADGNDGPFKDEADYITGPDAPPAELGSQDADILWVYDMMDELGVFPHNASNSSPLVLGDLVYVCTSNGQDWTHSNIPSPRSPSFIALDRHTGELRGEDDAEIGEKIFHGQWTSPSAGKVNGQWQVFFGGGDGICYALDATPTTEDDGDYIKKIWWVDGNPPEYKAADGKPIIYPDADGPSEINSTPVFWNNRVYVAIGQDPEHGEGVGRLLCIDPTKKGDVTDSAIVWDSKDVNRSISTVSIDPESRLLFIADYSGFIYCFDADTGKKYWVYDMKAHMWGSTFVADGKVYAGDEDGDFVILKVSKEKELLEESNFGAPIYSTPIVANGIMYVGTQTHLYALRDPVKQGRDETPRVDSSN